MMRKKSLLGCRSQCEIWEEALLEAFEEKKFFAIVGSGVCSISVLPGKPLLER